MAKRQTQKTPKGHEIPIPTKGDVMKVFKKSAQPISEPEPSRRRPSK